MRTRRINEHALAAHEKSLSSLSSTTTSVGPTLLTQDHVAVLPRDHRLAGRATLVPTDLEGDPLSRTPSAPRTL